VKSCVMDGPVSEKKLPNLPESPSFTLLEVLLVSVFG
jgi:hypothetical protein